MNDVSALQASIMVEINWVCSSPSSLLQVPEARKGRSFLSSTDSYQNPAESGVNQFWPRNRPKLAIPFQWIPGGMHAGMHTGMQERNADGN